METSTEWRNRTAWITGASSGIGEAMARELGARGARLILSGRRIEALESVAAETGGETFILPFEASDFAAIPEIVETAQDWRGPIDLLVNNAGIGQRSLAIDTRFEVYQKILEIDFLAPVRLTQLVLPAMVARGSGQIAVIDSISGKLGSPMRTGYCAAKHACVGYFEALRSEIELAYGIGVTLIFPGFVNTSIAVNALAADGSRRGRTDDDIAAGLDPASVAQVVVDGLSARAREVVIAGKMESDALDLRLRDPEALFDFMADKGLQLARERAEAGGSLSINPHLSKDL